MRTLCFFSGASQGHADGLGGLTSRHRFCTYTGVQMKMALRVTKDLVAESAAREQVPFS